MEPETVVELRVHGVSGTPPEELLGRPLVVQVAGDRQAGFYRPRLAVERTDDVEGEPIGSGPALEGYSWGRLTSGAASRAFWLLLLPFTLVNVAVRLRPYAATGADRWYVRLADRGVWYLSRVLALTLTSTLVLAAVGVGVDLVGWQCAGPPSYGQPVCGGLASWLRPDAGPFDDLGLRLVLGALLPLALLAMLVILSWFTWHRYEQSDRDPDADFQAPAADCDPSPLSHRDAWRGEHLVARLRLLHVAMGLTTIAGSLAWASYDAAVPHDGSMTLLRLPDAGADLAGWLLLWSCGGLILVLFTLVAIPPMVYRRPSVAARRWARIVALAGLLLLVASAWSVLASDSLTMPTGALPGYAGQVTNLFSLQAVLVLLFTLGLLVLRVRAGRCNPALPSAGMAAAVIAALALLLAATLSAGLFYQAAALISSGRLRFRSAGTVRDSIPSPPSFSAASVAFVIGVLLCLVVAVIWIFVQAARGIPPARVVARRAVPGIPPILDKPDGCSPALLHEARARQSSLTRAIWLARLVDGGGGLAGAAVGLVAVLGVAGTWWVFSGGWLAYMKGCASPTTDSVTTGCGVVGDVISLGIWSIGLFAILLVSLGFTVFRVKATRRSVGILWDLGSFWPRSVHPFAAPCYAERTVPDLIDRVRYHVAGGAEPGQPPAGGVVLACHSQGSVIGAAVVLQLAVRCPETLERMAFFTYGCVLRRLYARFFPGYFGEPVLAEIEGQLLGPEGSRWLNAWRHTDYLAGPVRFGPPIGSDIPDAAFGLPDAALDITRVGQVDVQFVDPTGFARLPGDLSFPSPGRHSNYPSDPRFARKVKLLAGRLPGNVEPETAKSKKPESEKA
jgi:hypothetical protein